MRRTNGASASIHLPLTLTSPKKHDFLTSEGNAANRSRNSQLAFIPPPVAVSVPPSMGWPSAVPGSISPQIYAVSLRFIFALLVFLSHW